MPEFKEVRGSIEVPSNTGTEGFIHTLREVLKLSRIQEIKIDSRGQVTFKRFVLDQEEPENNFRVNFTDVEPYAVIRNASVKEFSPGGLPAPVVVGMMFDKASQESMSPLAFATGAHSVLKDWYRYTSGYTLEASDQLFGLPLLPDRQIPDTVLLLCTGYGRDASFLDTRVSYKVEMPSYVMPDTNVEVIP